MPNVRRLQRDGMTFRQFMVSDSLCCSSRATILTGEFPHNTHVLGNTRPGGGYPAFRRLRRALAEHRPLAPARRLPDRPARQVPQPLPPGSRRSRSRLGRVARARAGPTRASATSSPTTATRRVAGFKPRDYVTDVLARRAARFIRRSPPPAVLRARVDLRAAQAVHAGAPPSVAVPAPADAARRLVRRADQRRSALARAAARLASGPAAAPPARVPHARAIRAGGRRDDRPAPRHRARRRRRPPDVLRVQLRQRLPPRPAPPDRGQADGVRPRHPRAARSLSARACRAVA